MPEFLKELLSSDGFMPHGHCYLWRPEMVWQHLLSDALTSIAYISIPFTLLHIVRRRRDIPFHWMFLCFGVFIIACGATHVMEIWTLWTPTYWLAGVIKAITALASIATAILLIKLVPGALTLPTPKQLASAHAELQDAHEILERRVAERTAELTRKNAELASEIQERRRAEHELATSESLREAEAKFRALLEAAPEAMVIVDERARIVLINAETEQLFGYTRAELLGHPVELLVPEAARAAHAAHRQAYVAGSVGRRIMGRGQQLAGRRRDGTEFPADISVNPLATHDGLLILTAIRDVTDRIRTEQALRRAKDAAEAANAELEAFSYSVAHDLRSPLRSLSGYSTALLEDYGDKLDGNAKEYLHRTVTSAQRMSDIIDALLMLARLTRIEPQHQPVNLTELAHTVIKQLRASEPSREVDFVAADNLLVDGDPQLLLLVLENLIGNAWKFTGKQPAARVELGRQEVNGTLAYYVRDNGAGFDMNLVDKLFAPFRRLHTQTDFEGTGIGLATVQRIVRRHGGRVWAEGAEAQGATFRFTLPTLLPAHPAAPSR